MASRQTTGGWEITEQVADSFETLMFSNVRDFRTISACLCRKGVGRKKKSWKSLRARKLLLGILNPTRPTIQDKVSSSPSCILYELIVHRTSGH